MKTFIAEIIPKIQQFSERLDNKALLTNQHWVLIENIDSEKHVYLFRPNNELLISKNGRIQKGKWEFLGNKSLIIDINDEAFLFKHGFFDENLLALKIDSKDEYALFVNETKFEGEINSYQKAMDFLANRYLPEQYPQVVLSKGTSAAVLEQVSLNTQNVGPMEVKDPGSDYYFWLAVTAMIGILILMIWAQS